LITDSLMIELLSNLGISSLKPVQVQAISKGLFFHQNILICTPSGSGKTLVGIMAMANILLKGLGSAIYLVPYKALAAEKETQFKKIFQPNHISVKAITGDTEENSVKP